jgi:hypothetical protein
LGVLCGLRHALAGNYEQDDLQHVDDHVAENSEAVKGANGLPDGVARVFRQPHGYFRQDEQQVHDAEHDCGSGDLDRGGGTILRASASLRFCHTK